VLPPGARRLLADPFRQKRSPWPWILLIVALLAAAAWMLDKRGLIHRWSDGRFGTAAEITAPPAKPTLDTDEAPFR